MEEFQEEAWTRGPDPDRRGFPTVGLFGSGSWEVPTVGGGEVESGKILSQTTFGNSQKNFRNSVKIMSP